MAVLFSTRSDRSGLCARLIGRQVSCFRMRSVHFRQLFDETVFRCRVLVSRRRCVVRLIYILD